MTQNSSPASRLNHRGNNRPVTTEIADLLNMHPRTLRRRLSDEGTTFDDIFEDVRRTMARELIELTDMKLAEVADALAFGSQSTFSDWFIHSFGTPPMRWRRVRARDLLTP